MSKPLALFSTLFLTAFTVNAAALTTGGGQVIPQGAMDPELVPIAYSGGERFRYDLSWSGGIKIGELELEIKKVAAGEDEYELHALVTTTDSIFDTLYPVHDVHVTKVRGSERYPYSYEVWQQEGFSYEAHRLTSYNQQKGRIRYQKNEEKPVVYKVAGPTHNEFSSFFSSRLMAFTPGTSFLVPTFADKKRVEVEVKVGRKSTLADTLFGSIETIEVSPILPFKGLYDKRGDTIIWYTADECRVPVQITSKIAIGSVTSTLQEYSNPACGRYDGLARGE